MFSGIVETTGTIDKIIIDKQCKHFTIRPQKAFDDLHIGDSVAINGACLTVTQLTQQTFNVTAVLETLQLTNLNNLTAQHAVNLERAVKANSRLGGHFVQGHVDCLGKISDIKKNQAWLMTINIPKAFARYIVYKGYITLDGMSITIVEVTEDCFSVTLIPHTINETIAQYYTIHDLINIEVDILGKYVEKLAQPFLGK